MLCLFYFLKTFMKRSLFEPLQILQISNYIIGEKLEASAVCWTRSWNTAGPSWSECIQVNFYDTLFYFVLHLQVFFLCIWSISLLTSPPKGVRIPLDPKDEELLRDDDPITPIKSVGIKKKERPTDKGVSWLVKTQYISPLSMDSAKQVMFTYFLKALDKLCWSLTRSYCSTCSLWLKNKQKNCENLKVGISWRNTIAGYYPPLFCC